MSYPLIAYTYIDPSTNNNFPITNSTFVYGTLGPCNWTGLTSGLTKGYTTSSTNYGSLDISSNGLYGNTQLVSLYNYGTDASNIARHTISANQTGIYRLKTTLSFTGLSLISTSDLVFLLTNLDAINTQISPTNFVQIFSDLNLSLSSFTTNTILSFGYMYSNTVASGGYITFNTTAVPSYYCPEYNVYSTSSSGIFTNSGICVVDVILYLQQNKPLYFNIQLGNGSTSSYLNATGNFELEMLFAYPTPNYINTLMNYKYNNIPVMNSNFLYNSIFNTSWINSYVSEGTSYGSLGVNSNPAFIYGNTELVNFINYYGNYYTIQVKQSGIYRLITTLSFSGSNLTTNTIYPIGIAYTTSVCKNTALSSELLLSLNGTPSVNNNISAYVSLGYLYSSSSNPTYIFNTSSGTTYPVASINSKASGISTFNNNGISVFESILYLSSTQPLYFNISPNSNVYLSINGGYFMLELLSYTTVITTTITNAISISNSGVQNSNGYNYIEFYPTSSIGTATFTFSSNVTLNYLLVGGGGGGGLGSDEGSIGGGGGGGGGSSINGSTSGTIFNISVGNYGIGSSTNNPGGNGYTSSIGASPSNNNIAIAYGGGGGGSQLQSFEGGGIWNPVPDPSGNGSINISTKGGNNEANGSTGYIINTPFNKSYSISGSGAGGSNGYYGGGGGNNSTAGLVKGNTTYYGGVGSGYGTGGGGGSLEGNIAYLGGNGGSGLIVLYWQ